MSNTPSDAQVLALAQQHLNAFAQFSSGEVWFEGEVDFARAVLAKLGTPQPVVREPLGNKELQAISLEYSDSEDECTGFRDGWRFAEKHYGITQKGGSNADTTTN